MKPIKKNHVVQFKVTKAEWEFLQRKAKEGKFPLSELLHFQLNFAFQNNPNPINNPFSLIPKK